MTFTSDTETPINLVVKGWSKNGKPVSVPGAVDWAPTVGAPVLTFAGASCAVSDANAESAQVTASIPSLGLSATADLNFTPAPLASITIEQA